MSGGGGGGLGLAHLISWTTMFAMDHRRAEELTIDGDIGGENEKGADVEANTDPESVDTGE